MGVNWVNWSMFLLVRFRVRVLEIYFFGYFNSYLVFIFMYVSYIVLERNINIK